MLFLWEKDVSKIWVHALLSSSFLFGSFDGFFFLLGTAMLSPCWKTKENFLPYFLSGSKEACPTTNGGMQNGSSVGICTCCIDVFARFGVDLQWPVGDY